MPQISVKLAPTLRDRLDGVARRFSSSRGEIARRALEHYVRHVEELEIAHMASPETGRPDWGAIKAMLCNASCPYQDCPFAGACPVDVCPL
jgi:predicted DNA-binding protein